MNVFDLFAKISLDTSEYENGLNEASSKSSSFASKIGGGLATAGKMGAVAIAAVGTATIGVTKDMISGASEVAAYGDNIDKMSQKMGLTAEAYQEWDAVMQHSGTSMETMKASMKTLANAVETGNEAFEKLGLSQEQLAEMSQQDIFEATIAALQNVEDTTERTYLAGKLLGRGATELGALLNTSAEDTQAMRDRVRELGGVMSDDAVKAAAQFQDNLQDLQTAFSGIKRGIMSDLLPGMNSLMDGFTRLLAGEDGAEELIADGIDNLIESVGNGLEKAITLGEKILPKLADTIVNHLPDLMKIGLMVIETVGSAIIQNLPSLIKSGLEIIVTLADSLISNLPTLIPAIVDVILQIVETLTDPDTLVQLVEAGLQLIIALGQGILAALPELIERVPTIIGNLADALLRAAPVIISAVVGLLSVIWDNLKTYGEKLVGWIAGVGADFLNHVKESGANVLASIIEWLVQVPEKMAYYAGYAVGLFIDFIRQMPERATEFFKNLIAVVVDFGLRFIQEAPKMANGFRDKLIGTIRDLPDKFLKIGGDIVTGLWNGIKGGWNWLTDKVKDLACKLLQGAKDALGIASPSKEFAWVGKMVDEGFALGIEQNEHLPVEQAKKSFSFADDLVTDVKNDAVQAKSSTSNASDIESIVRGMLNEMSFVVPVYIGGDKVDEKVIRAGNDYNFRSGGR